MQLTNQIFVQLNEANRCACAQNPHFRRLAVILLDNIVEVQLARKADHDFLFDRTTWYNGVRKYSTKKRREVLRFHAPLLAFGVEQGWLTADEELLLGFAHRVRNAFYHEGKDHELDAELAVLLLYRLIRTRFPDWKTGIGMFGYGYGDPIPINSAEQDKSGRRPMLIGDLEPGSFGGDTNSDEYWTDALSRVLSYDPSVSICTLIHRKLMALIERIEVKINFIKENCDIDFFDVLLMRFNVVTPIFEQDILTHKKMGNPIPVLNFYLALLQAEEKLHDIEDPQLRADECHRILNAHTFNKNPITKKRLAAYKAQAKQILKGTEGEGIAIFLRIEKETRPVANALEEFASDLDGHISHLIDEARGK